MTQLEGGRSKGEERERGGRSGKRKGGIRLTLEEPNQSKLGDTLPPAADATLSRSNDLSTAAAGFSMGVLGADSEETYTERH